MYPPSPSASCAIPASGDLTQSTAAQFRPQLTCVVPFVVCSASLVSSLRVRCVCTSSHHRSESSHQWCAAASTASLLPSPCSFLALWWFLVSFSCPRLLHMGCLRCMYVTVVVVFLSQRHCRLVPPSSLLAQCADALLIVSGSFSAAGRRTRCSLGRLLAYMCTVVLSS
ncbi:hypothetical protein FB45DRAFT_912210, partial [Roridomyces roridus]